MTPEIPSSSSSPRNSPAQHFSWYPQPLQSTSTQPRILSYTSLYCLNTWSIILMCTWHLLASAACGATIYLKPRHFFCSDQNLHPHFYTIFTAYWCHLTFLPGRFNTEQGFLIGRRISFFWNVSMPLLILSVDLGSNLGYKLLFHHFAWSWSYHS